MADIEIQSLQVDNQIQVQKLKSLLSQKDAEYQELKQFSIQRLGDLKKQCDFYNNLQKNPITNNFKANQLNYIAHKQTQLSQKEQAIEKQQEMMQNFQLSKLEYETITQVIKEQDKLLQILQQSDNQKLLEINQLNNEMQIKNSNILELQHSLQNSINSKQDIKKLLKEQSVQLNVQQSQLQQSQQQIQSQFNYELLQSQQKQHHIEQLNKTKIITLEKENQVLKQILQKSQQLMKQTGIHSNNAQQNSVHNNSIKYDQQSNLEIQLVKQDLDFQKGLNTKNDIQIKQLQNQLLGSQKHRYLIQSEIQNQEVNQKELLLLNDQIVSLQQKAAQISEQLIQRNIENAKLRQQLKQYSQIVNSQPEMIESVKQITESEVSKHFSPIKMVALEKQLTGTDLDVLNDSYTSSSTSQMQSYKNQSQQQLINEIKHLKQLNKQQSQQIHDLKLSQLNSQHMNLDQHNQQIEQLNRKIIQIQQENDNKNTLYNDLSKFVQLLQEENIELKKQIDILNMEQ